MQGPQGPGPKRLPERRAVRLLSSGEGLLPWTEASTPFPRDLRLGFSHVAAAAGSWPSSAPARGRSRSQIPACPGYHEILVFSFWFCMLAWATVEVLGVLLGGGSQGERTRWAWPLGFHGGWGVSGWGMGVVIGGAGDGGWKVS